MYYKYIRIMTCQYVFCDEMYNGEKCELPISENSIKYCICHNMDEQHSREEIYFIKQRLMEAVMRSNYSPFDSVNDTHLSRKFLEGMALSQFIVESSDDEEECDTSQRLSQNRVSDIQEDGETKLE